MVRISLISLKGGVGKTTIAFNLATYLSYYLNKKVILIDANFESSNSFIYLRFKPKVFEEIWQGIYPTPYGFHIKILHENSLNQDFSIFDKFYDFVLIDVGTRYTLIKEIEKKIDLQFLIINPDYLTIYTNYALYKFLDKNRTKIILNKYNKKIDADIVSAIFEAPLFCVIPYCNDQIEAELRRIPCVIYKKNSKFAKAIEEIVEYLTGMKLRKSIYDIILEKLGLG